MARLGSLVALGRTGIGVGAWVAPVPTGRLFGLDPDLQPQATYTGRLFGARDAILGAGALMSGGSRSWVAAGMLADMADVGAAVLGGREHAISDKTVRSGGAVAVIFAVLSLLALLAGPRRRAADAATA